MRGRLLHLLDNIRSSLWLWPVILTIAALLFAQGTVMLDRSGWLEHLELTWLFGAGITGARTLLATVATAMISIAATVFSVTIVALSLAAGQMGPRLLRTFMRDRGTQASLGTFIATFAFCISVLAVADGSGAEDFVPRASVTAALLLSMTSMAVLIYFIHHVAASIQAPNVIALVGDELEQAIDRLFPSDSEDAQDWTDESPSFGKTGKGAGLEWSVLAPRSGYLQLIDDESLLKAAGQIEGLIELMLAPGDHVIMGTPIARVQSVTCGRESASAMIQAAITIGAIRTPVQDVRYLIQRIVEIAQRALSPSINDPTTAETCINRLGVAVAALMQRKPPNGRLRDKQGVLRLIIQRPTFGELLDAAFDPIRHYSRNSPQVSRRFAGLIEELASLARDSAHREALCKQARQSERAATELHDEADRNMVDASVRRTPATLGAPAQN